LGAAVAVCRASPVPLHVKWPNDILDSGGAKLGGILAEAEFLGGEVEYLVLGIGLNVEAPPSSVPNTTCLGALGFDPSQTLALGFRVVEELLSVTALLEREPSDVLGMWRQYSATLGAQVQVGELSGTAVDIGDDGALIVRGADDQIHRVLAGDVQLLRTMTGRS